MTGDLLVLEVGGKDGVEARGIAVRADGLGEDSTCSAFRRRLAALAVSPPVVGLSRFCTTMMGREGRCSGGVDDGGGVRRAETFCVAGIVAAPSCDTPGAVGL